MKFSKTFSRIVLTIASTCTVLQPIAASAGASFSARIPINLAASNPTVTKVDFGTLAIGALPQTTVVFRNSSNKPMTFGADTLETRDEAYILGTTCPEVLSPSASCTLTVGLGVFSEGTIVGEVVIYTGGASGPDLIQLTAQGSPDLPLLVAEPASKDFGLRSINMGPGPAHLVTLRNQGEKVADISDIVVTAGVSSNGAAINAGATFQANASACLTVLAPGEACDIEVSFAPTLLGLLTARLQVNLADGGVTQVGSLMGTGVQGTPSWTVPPTFKFLDLTVGTSSPAQTLYLQNTGKGDLLVTSLSTQGNSTFTLVGHDCPAALTPGDQCAVQVQARLATSTPQSGFLVLNSSQSSEPVSKVPLTAVPLAVPFSEPVADPAVLEFLDIPVGQRATQAVELKNVGTQSFDIDSFEATPPLLVASDCPSTLPAAASCVMTVSVTPADAELLEGEVTVNTNATRTGTLAIPVLVMAAVVPDTFDISTTALNFGSVQLGSSASLSIAVLNTTADALTLRAPVLNDPEYTASHNCSAVPAFGDCVVTVTFTPTTQGAVTGALTLTDGVNTRAAALTGQGTAAVLTLDTSALSFGTVLLGGSATQTITIANDGNLSANLGATAGPGYAISGGTCSATLAAGAQCTLDITFTPTEARAYPATLALSGSSSGNQSLPLSGTGARPATTTFDVSATTVTFPGVPVGTPSTQMLSVLNTGTLPLTLPKLTVAGAAFSAEHNCASVAAGQSCLVAVTFTPTVAQPVAGSVVLSAGASTHTVTLSGTGTASVITVGPPSFDFAGVLVGASAVQTFTLTNSGTDPVAPGLSVGNGYSVTASTCGAALTAGASCTVSVTFSPLAEQSYPGALSVTGATGGPVNVVLTGTGLNASPSWSLSTTAVSFGSVPANTSHSASVMVLNDGPVPLVPFAASVSGSLAYDAISGCAVVLLPGESCVVNVTFLPDAEAQSFTGTLTLAQPGLSQTAALTGASNTVSKLVVSSALIDFGIFRVGTDAPMERTLTLSNPGSAATAAIAFNLPTGAGQTYYLKAGADNCSGQALAVNASCTVTLVFSPSAAGTFTQPVSITGATGPAPSLSLTGRGGLPSFDVSATALDFGKTLVNSNPVRSITLRNTGASPMTVTASSTNAAYQTNVSACANVAANASCTATVRYANAAQGTANGTVSFVSGGVTRSVSLTGFAGTVSMDWPGFEFLYGAALGEIVPITLYYTNTGTLHVDLTSTAGELTGLEFVSGSLPSCKNLAPGATCTAVVNIKVNTISELWGQIDAEAHFHDAVSGQSFTDYSAPFFIIGDSLDFKTVGASAIDFGATGPGTTLTRELELTNNGAQILRLSSVSFTGSRVFAATHNCQSLDPGATCTISASFTPTAVASYSGVLNMYYANSSTPTPISLTGSGAATDGVSLTYGAVRVGTSSYGGTVMSTNGGIGLGQVTMQSSTSIASYNVTVTNLTGELLTTGSLATGASAVSTVLMSSTTCGATLAVGASCLRTFKVGGTGPAPLTVSYIAPGNRAVTTTASVSYYPGAPYTLTGADFGGLGPNVTATRTVTLTNNVPMNSYVTFALPSSAYSVVATPATCAGNNIPSNTSCTYTVQLRSGSSASSVISGAMTMTGTYGGASAQLSATFVAPPPPPPPPPPPVVAPIVTQPTGNVTRPPLLISTRSNSGAEVAYYWFNTYADSCWAKDASAWGGPITAMNSCQMKILEQSYPKGCYYTHQSGPYPYWNTYRVYCRV